MVEYINSGKIPIAIIIRNSFSSKDIQFFSPKYFPQQLGYMKRKKDYIIEPHFHNKISREITLTQEVLFIKKGKIRVDLYNEDKIYIESCILKKGDIVLLANGGHGFTMLEESEIIEVKQGPYLEDKDKEKFDPVDDARIILKNE